MSYVWHFGNTTVRNPHRIRSGLKVLQQSGLNGNLVGTIQERRFADALEDAGVINITNKDRDYSDMGRKWRSCFSQLGFITHKFSRGISNGDTDNTITEVLNDYPIQSLSGYAYEITPNGQRLIDAESVKQQNECFLRALLAYQIPSKIEPRNGNKLFSPLIFILQVLKQLSNTSDKRGLSKTEMALVQVCRDHNQVDQVVQKIMGFRSEYDSANGRVAKRRSERNLLQQIAGDLGRSPDTLKDYADVNFRYPRYTGLVSLQGKRLVIHPDKEPVVDMLIDKHVFVEEEKEYLYTLWTGAELPTDDLQQALTEAYRYKQKLLDANFVEDQLPSIPHDTEDVAEINMVRLEYEELYQKYLEQKFAEKQREIEQINETIAFLKKLDGQQVNEEYEIEIDDEPSYLEWAVWRAFLAINELKNKPHEARRFKVDQDFLPISTATGGGADMVFEFEDFVLVVEVTLTTSSRQEAAEGEPVRRHVAKEKANYQDQEKPVYGLFLAKTINNNTAETFRIGVWYHGDEPDFINIVPLTLKQFIMIMEKFKTERFNNKEFRKLLDSCLIPRNAHAPAWKREIEKTVYSFIN